MHASRENARFKVTLSTQALGMDIRVLLHERDGYSGNWHYLGDVTMDPDEAEELADELADLVREARRLRGVAAEANRRRHPRLPRRKGGA